MHPIQSYAKLFSAAVGGVTDFSIEDIVPAPFTVVVKLAKPDEITKGGIIIPPNCQDEKGIGVVMAVNPDDDPPCYWKPGDIVLFFKNAGQKLDIDGCDDYVTMRSRGDVGDEILAKVQKRA